MNSQVRLEAVEALKRLSSPCQMGSSTGAGGIGGDSAATPGVRKRHLSGGEWDDRGVVLPGMPWRLLAGLFVAGLTGGAVFGFVRGLDNLPTLPFAIFEGGFLIGVPATVLGLILVGVWSLGSALRRQPGSNQPKGVAASRPRRNAVARPTQVQDQSAVRLLCIAAEVVGGVIAIIAAGVLPWAKYRLQGASAVVSLDAGRLTVALVAVGTTGAVLATLQLRWRAMALESAEVVVGGAALVLSVVMAAGRIAHANSLKLTSGGSTAFAAGAVLALLAALLLISAAIVILIQDSPGRREPEPDRSVTIGPCVGRTNGV